ncbi:MAG: hypothetical protein NWE89_13420 [Candidatus Bathyarchaeota archaeon]|nr:hypothetical protein [Candidatus Bathyarchaeota archaeon]
MSKLNFWIRDPYHPLLPYQSSGHNFRVVILTADYKPLNFGAVHHGVFALTHQGPRRGKVHGQVEVPPGCYIVVGYASCKNVLTDFALVQVGCGKEVCVNLITKTMATCRNQLIWALNLAYKAGNQYKPASEEGSKIPKKVAGKVLEALKELGEYLPEDHVTPALPIDEEELLERVNEEEK